MSKFTFKTDDAACEFCETIAATMVRLFGIPEAEAIGRINRDWEGIDFLGVDTELWRYRESEETWANDIYFGHGSHWWMEDASPTSRPWP